MITLCRKVKEHRMYYSNGNIMYIYYLNKYGNYHNLDGPAYIGYYENGNKWYEWYYINGEQCRLGNKASYIKYSKKGDILIEEYLVNGVLQRATKTNGISVVSLYSKI